MFISSGAGADATAEEEEELSGKVRREERQRRHHTSSGEGGPVRVTVQDGGASRQMARAEAGGNNVPVSGRGARHMHCGG